jgi:subtilisin family serine protease
MAKLLFGAHVPKSEDTFMMLKEGAVKKMSITIIFFASFLSIGVLGIRNTMATQKYMTGTGALQNQYAPDEVLVKFKTTAKESAIVAAMESVKGMIITHQGRLISSYEWATWKLPENLSFPGDPGLCHVRVPASIGPERAIAVLMANPSVEYAEKNFIYSNCTIPDDQHFWRQWGLHNTGQSGGAIDADIDAPEAWDIFTGSPGITIAITDTGIDYGHIDLQANIWNNPGETGDGKETDGVDNDGNGYIDDWRGWDFVNFDNDPMDDNAYWEYEQYREIYHGTHVAGIAGAKANNNEGVAGICWDVKLMALKMLNDRGEGTLANAINAIDYARASGANIINASWGGYSYAISLYRAIERTKAAGILVIAAAGNENLDTDSTTHYPSGYDLDNIISVLSTDHNDAKSGFSNYGYYSVDLGAPGGSDSSSNNPANIFSTKYHDRYQYLAGTSMATPFVSGTAALVLGQRPNLDWWQNKTILLKSVDVIQSLNLKTLSSGRLNAHSALLYPTPVLPTAPTNLAGSASSNGDTFDITLIWTDNSNNESGFNIYMKTGNVFLLLDAVGPNSTTYVLSDVGAGLYYFYVRAYCTDGESPKTETISVRAQ